MTRAAVLLRVELALLVALHLACAASAVAQPPIIERGRAFACTPTRIWDGDGPIWCREGPRVRLARINARELDDECRPGAPCPATSGVAARDQLAELLGGARGRTRAGHTLVSGPALRCRSDGWGGGDRTAAWCARDGRDLSAELLRTGHAAPWRAPRPRR